MSPGGHLCARAQPVRKWLLFGDHNDEIPPVSHICHSVLSLPAAPGPEFWFVCLCCRNQWPLFPCTQQPLRCDLLATACARLATNGTHMPRNAPPPPTGVHPPQPGWQAAASWCGPWHHPGHHRYPGECVHGQVYMCAAARTSHYCIALQARTLAVVPARLRRAAARRLCHPAVWV